MANAAVSAVKKGCQLYKDIKGAAGDIKGVLKDLDEQFAANHKDKPATVAQRNIYIEEKNRVIELNKKQGETAGIYQELANYLGDFFDNMNKCMAVIEEEERKNREEIYEGDASLGRRALQLVIMKKQLEQMKTELREMLVYNSPPELGGMWTDVNEMMTEIGEQQKILLTKKMRAEEVITKRRAAIRKKIRDEAIWGALLLVIIFCFSAIMAVVVNDRIKKYPELGTGIIPKMNDEYKANRDEHRRDKLLNLIERHKDELVGDK
jgi:hypothetical protein